MRGRILKGIGGFYYALDGEGALHTLRAQGKLRREHMKPLVGDFVEMAPGTEGEDGWILSILPRKNCLTRPPVANVDTVLIVLAAASPQPDLLLADRLLIAARAAGLNAYLAVNKRDLDPAAAEEILRQYAGAQASPLAVSARTGEGLEALRAALAGGTLALAGQSGAGKSSLINALYGLRQETGGLSDRIARGKNTTRRCELIPLPGGGMVLDTPGFSLMENELTEPGRIKDLYPEFAPCEGRCFFDGCLHVTEPRCAVREAVAAGGIDPARHARYAQLVEEMRIRWRDRYD